MSSLSEILQNLEDQIEDLQRNTKFCLNSYDYHHKNNEYEILKSLQEILRESLEDGEEFEKNIDNVVNNIKIAREKCFQADEMLKKLSISEATKGSPVEESDVGGTKGNCASKGRTVSFKEEVDYDDNKENTF